MIPEIEYERREDLDWWGNPPKLNKYDDEREKKMSREIKKGIKGFDNNLCCYGMQYEIGKEYNTGFPDDKLSLCSDTVFHYCKSLEYVHSFYDVHPKFNNRFCEIEVLGEEITDGVKYGSNRIKVIREIIGEELDILRGWKNHNTGLFNTGHRNTGDYNTGNYNTGYRNTRNYNTGHYNTGHGNTGDCNTGIFNTGHRNTGDYNTGNYNTGYRNTGIFNSCDYSTGIFCTQPPKISIFNIQTPYTFEEFQNTEYYYALFSVPFVLTEWIYYTDKEKADDVEKKNIGGYLKKYTYKEACQNWWGKMNEYNKELIMKMPNFNSEIFEEITGIEV